MDKGFTVEFTFIDPKTGKEFRAVIQEPQPAFFEFVGNVELNDAQIRARIDRMDVSADTKALLYSFSKSTLNMGKVLVKIGRKVIDILFTMLRQFPHMTFGVLFGLILGALVASIPLIGMVLGPVAFPIAIAFGVTLGAKADFAQGDIGDRIAAILAEFAPLRT